MEKRAGGNGSESGAGAQPQVPRMRPEEYRRISRGRLEATKNKGIKGKGKHSVILHCVKTPVAWKTGWSEYHQQQFGLDLEPKSGRDSDRGLSGLEAEPEGSLGGVAKGRGQEWK
jgi:hypothetical protein